MAERRTCNINVKVEIERRRRPTPSTSVSGSCTQTLAQSHIISRFVGSRRHLRAVWVSWVMGYQGQVGRTVVWWDGYGYGDMASTGTVTPLRVPPLGSDRDDLEERSGLGPGTLALCGLSLEQAWSVE
ncbi:hypothetical protein FA13DRAFT_1706137 [Coprinellus micaceus]|uniref:Uncharacterized protein n=1 Tax=Coprinellus micaceus TaxID=71717 RepID=A0A4Y7TS03_COPMI|nr:hypothetical protein FA13DRAFT_1706137 [Coprinellus micaceus]